MSESKESKESKFIQKNILYAKANIFFKIEKKNKRKAELPN